MPINKDNPLRLEIKRCNMLNYINNEFFRYLIDNWNDTSSVGHPPTPYTVMQVPAVKIETGDNSRSMLFLY